MSTCSFPNTSDLTKCLLRKGWGSQEPIRGLNMEPILCAVGARLALQKVDQTLAYWVVSGVLHDHSEMKECTATDLQKTTSYIHKKAIACSDCVFYRRFFNWWSSSRSASGMQGENS